MRTDVRSLVKYQIMTLDLRDARDLADVLEATLKSESSPGKGR